MNSQNKKKYLELLKEKYKAFPDRISPNERKIGTELEFHIIPKDGSTPDFNIYKNILNELLPSLNFEKTEFDYDGNAVKGKNQKGDIISYECGYAIIEISLAPEKDLNIINKRTKHFINEILSFLEKLGLTLLDSGINPFEWAKNIPILRNKYYYMLNHFFEKYNLNKEFSFINAQTFICAEQLHIDCSKEEVFQFINIVNKLGWIKALLFANSPYKNDNKKSFCIRDQIWQDSAFAYHQNNCSIRNVKFETFEDVLLETLNNSIFHIKKNDDYILFTPTKLINYLESKSLTGWIINPEKFTKTKIIPKEIEIKYSRLFNHAVITPLGTIEIKSECQQPFEDIMSPLAFHLGIASNLNTIESHLETISEYINETNAKEFREKAVNLGYNIQNELSFDIQKFIYKLLILIKEGVKKRNKSEDVFLDCLFTRLENKTNPANECLKKNKSISKIINKRRDK